MIQEVVRDPKPSGHLPRQPGRRWGTARSETLRRLVRFLPRRGPERDSDEVMTRLVEECRGN
jgi:hypothetical protein